MNSLSQKVIALLTEGSPNGSAQAWALIESAYPGRPTLARKAYLLALRIVLKEIERRPVQELLPLPPVSPQADLALTRAGRALRTDDLRGAYAALQTADLQSASHEVLISLARRLIARAPTSQRYQEFHYTPGKITLIEGAHIVGAGMIQVSEGNSVDPADRPTVHFFDFEPAKISIAQKKLQSA